MLDSQKFEVRRSEVRERINTINAQAELADGEGDELDTLTREYADLERRYRAAIVTEAEEQDIDTRERIADGEGAELRRLREAVSIGDYMRAASTTEGLSSAATDYNQALSIPAGVEGVAMPIAMLRADAPTTTTALDGGQPQRSIMQRIFGPGILDNLGVRLDSVPAGRPEWPLLTGGVSPEQTAENTAKDSEAATFAPQTLKPKRLTANYQWTVEQAAQVMGLEEALRVDLSAAARSAMSTQVYTGDGTGVNVRGFLTAYADPGDPSAESTFKDYTSAAASAVDGLHATMESEVSGVIGVATYQHAAGVYTDGSDASALEVMGRRMRAVTASTYVPAAASDIQDGNILHAGGGGVERGDSIGAVWPSVEMIRDPYGGATSGLVRLTLVMLWDAYVGFRSGAYKRVAFKFA